MAQARIERLMNLVAYLSNTRRPLTLKEIVETIPGYPESATASRRAFERDKEDLRAMNFDVALEDTPDGESGYRIKSENTYFDVKLNSSQRSIVEYALALYGPQEKIASSALTKLGGMNPENSVGEVMSLAMPEFVDDIYIAIANKSSLDITFRGELRSVSPVRVIAKSGYWYMQAMDLNKMESRTFRIDRIEKLSQSKKEYVVVNNGDRVGESDEDVVEFIAAVNPALIEQFIATWNGERVGESLKVKFKVPRKELFLTRLFEYSGFVSVLEPEEIAKEVRELFSEAKSLIGGD